MKTYEIEKIRALLVADICKYVEDHIEFLKLNSSETIERFKDAEDNIECMLFNEALVRNDLLGEIKITVDGIDL